MEQFQNAVIIGLRNFQVTVWWFSASYLIPFWDFRDLAISIFEALYIVHIQKVVLVILLFKCKIVQLT